ncbi:MAG: ATP-binding protein [Chloroflexota bacterium]
MTLLERDRFLHELHHHLDETAGGKGRLVFLAGEAGVGKTSLVDRFSREVRDSTPVLRGGCDPLSTPQPLGPLVDIASQVGGKLAALLREPTQRHSIFSSFLDHLTVVGDGPALVILEDVHWADEATLDLLRFAGRRIHRVPALLIATYRNDEVGSRHPLRMVLGDLATSAATTRLTLPPLSQDAVKTLAKDSTIDSSELYERTGGNPFFVTEVLASQEAGIPPTVRDAVLARAGRLSNQARQILDTAAVIGFMSEAWLLAEVTDRGIDAVEECVATGVLQPVSDGFTFRHEIAREAILNDIFPQRLAALHRTILSALIASNPGETMLARLAHHAEGAGDREAVLKYAPAAARRARELHAHREAAAQLARALRFSSELETTERAMLLEEYLQESYFVGDMSNGIGAAEEAIEAQREAGNLPKVGENLTWLAVMLVTAGRNAEAERASQQSLILLESLPPGPELAMATGVQAHLRMLNRDNAEAISLGRKAIELGERFDDIRTVVRGHNTVGAAMIVSGDDDGRAFLERSVELARDYGLDNEVAAAYNNLGSGTGEMYQFDLADRYLAAGIAFATERDLDGHVDYMVAWKALSAMSQGRWLEATELAARVLRRPHGSAVARIMALIALGRVRSRRGDPEVWDTLDEALELAEQTATLQRVAPIREARAEAYWFLGQHDDVVAEARAAYDLALDHRHPWHVGELAYWLWVAGDLDAAPAYAAEPYALQIAGSWAEAAKAWERLKCPFESARARADSDDAAGLRQALEDFNQLGATPAAEIATDRLYKIGAQGIPRGPRPTTRANPAGLTARELEVTELIVRGRNNSEIAEQLYISPKTVAHHVSHVLAKLDARSRTEAAAKARELGIDPPI